jgi:hypothetical protein
LQMVYFAKKAAPICVIIFASKGDFDRRKKKT